MNTELCMYVCTCTIIIYKQWWVTSWVQNTHCDLRSPAVGRLHWHQRYSRSHHTLSPTGHQNTVPVCRHSESVRLAVSESHAHTPDSPLQIWMGTEKRKQYAHQSMNPGEEIYRIADYFRGVYISWISWNENFHEEDCTREVATLGTWVW